MTGSSPRLRRIHVAVAPPSIGPGRLSATATPEVLEALGLHVDEDPFGERRLELEDAVGVGLAEELVGLGVVERELVDVEVDPPVRTHHVSGLGDDGEVGQPEQVDLQQSDLGHAVHVVLGHRGAVTGSRALQRHDIGERFGSDHHGCRVRRCVAADPLQPLRVVDDVLRPVLVVVEVFQLAALRECSVERDVHHLRHQLREPVDVREGHVEHATHVADRRPRRHGTEGDDLRDAIATVLLLHVREHAIPSPVVEVDVDVGHLHALAVEEPLEDEPVAERLDVGDVEHVADQ